MSKAPSIASSGPGATELPEPLLTVGDTADILRLSSRQVRRLIADGCLPVVRIGRVIRVRPEDLRHLLKANVSR